MRFLLLICFVVITCRTNAQVLLSIDSIYVNDGALGIIVRLHNSDTEAVSVTVPRGNYLYQLPYAAGSLDSALKSPVPVSFAVFYNRQKMIDEPVAACNSRVPASDELMLQPGHAKIVKYETRCLGSSVIEVLNGHQPLNLEFYMIYWHKGRSHITCTPATRILVPDSRKTKRTR
jgi:hypothetical protein